MDTKVIGKVIAQKRKEMHMTQEVLSQKLNVTAKTISHWENGYTLPDISMLIPLSNILGITVYELLSGELDNRDTMNAVVNQEQEPNVMLEAEQRDKELAMTVQYAENNIEELKSGFKRWKIIFILTAIITVLLVYFFPLSLNKLVSQSNELSVTLTEFKIVNGEPVIDTKDYGKVKDSCKESIADLVKKYRYYRMPDTLFSDGTIDHITEDLIMINVYNKVSGYKIISISSGRIAIDNRTYYFPKSSEFIKIILELLKE